jgi:hypothetical protein
MRLMTLIGWFALFGAAAALSACGDDGGGDGDGGTGTDTDTDTDTGTDTGTDTDTDTDTGTDTGTDTATDDCAADAGLTDTLGTTPECATCLLDGCCPALLANDAAPTYETYLDLAMCSLGAACQSDCTGDVCGASGSWALNLYCGECIDASCCTEMGACRTDTECQACINGEYDQTSCCADPEFSAWAACIDTSCAAECVPCLDCQC